MGYFQATELLPKKGYWLAVTTACTTTIRGYPTDTYVEHYTMGWHMIGSLIEPMDFTEPCANPDGSIIATYGWNPNSGYYWADTLGPKQGYWIAVAQECSLAVGECPWSMGEKISDLYEADLFYKRYGSLPPPPPFVVEEYIETLIPGKLDRTAEPISWRRDSLMSSSKALRSFTIAPF